MSISSAAAKRPPTFPRPPRGALAWRAAYAVSGALTVALLLLAFLAARGKEVAAMSSPPVRFADASLSTGIRVRYAEQGDRAGQPVILLHGLSDSWFSFSPILPLLPPALRVFAPDLRGHGDSDRPERGYAPAEMASDVIDFLDAMEIRSATIVGHSMGSYIAQQVALAAPDRVDRLVLIGAATTLQRMNGREEFGAMIHQLTDPIPLEFTREFQVSTIHRGVPQDFVDRVSADSRRLPAHGWRGVFDGSIATPPAQIGEHQIPTLLLWGTHDAVFSRDTQDELLRLIPTATLTVYDETGHAVHWERPEETVRAITRFLGVP